MSDYCSFRWESPSAYARDAALGKLRFLRPFRPVEAHTALLRDDPLDDAPTVGGIVISRRQHPQGVHVVGQQHPGLNRSDLICRFFCGLQPFTIGGLLIAE
jgi:hypothetical protein